jgi:aspartate/methionine/tyrosine aminotransferase
MPIPPFKLERFFARYEFSVKYLLSASDCEGLKMAELLEMANPESLERWQNLKLDYTESAGHPLLRNEVARGYTQIKPEDVMIAVPEEAIYIAMQTLLQQNDHVIAIAPAYQSLHEIARSIGCSLSTWDLEPSEEGWSLNLDKLEDLFQPQTRLLIINFPNNPTGYLPTHEQFDAILALAKKHDVTIFSDEMYRLLEPEPVLRLPSVCDIYEKGITLSGLSKSFALPGLRLGWLATRQSGLIDAWLQFKDYTTICNSAPGEILGIIALQNTERIVNRNREIVRSNLLLAETFFTKHNTLVEWNRPRAGSIAFPKWLGTNSVDAFCQAVLDQQGVMIVPGSNFDHPGNHFRVGLGRKNFSEALEHLDKYFDTLE